MSVKSINKAKFYFVRALFAVICDGRPFSSHENGPAATVTTGRKPATNDVSLQKFH